MKKNSALTLAAGVVVATGLAVSSANASLMYSVSGPDDGDAIAGQQEFFDSTVNHVTEGFEGFTGSQQSGSFSTNVGTFSASGGASGQSCDYEDTFSCGRGLGIVDMNDTELVESDGKGAETYWGRSPKPDGEGNNVYLDSLDHEGMVFALNEGFNAVGFFLTDPNDAGGRLDINVSGGDAFSEDIDDIIGGGQSDNTVWYLSFFSTSGDIESLTFSGTQGDGIGIDNVTTARVPEPGVMALLGVGLVGLAAATRRRQRLN